MVYLSYSFIIINHWLIVNTFLKIGGDFLDWEKIGEKIKEARIKKGLSQTDIAKAIGVSNAFICQLESGKKRMSAENLLKLSKVLKVKFF